MSKFPPDNGRQGTRREKETQMAQGTTRADLGIWQNITLFASALVCRGAKERRARSEDCRSSAATRGARGYSRRTAEEQFENFWPTSITTTTLRWCAGDSMSPADTLQLHSGPEIELILSPQKLICKAPARRRPAACVTLFMAGVKWDFSVAESKNGTGRVMILGPRQDILNADLQILSLEPNAKTRHFPSAELRKMRKDDSGVLEYGITQCTNRFQRPSRPIVCRDCVRAGERECVYFLIPASVFIFTSAKINFCWWERSVITNTHRLSAAATS